MVSSAREQQNTKAVEATVGGLVWVRRRNGSWWPGQIVGLDEVSENYLASPKSGTPIKLLGRDDATVDWYNLEKSRRVKAFRCGEYDDCIEKAKASAASSSKKAVKYARRENAILHALELESSPVYNGHEDCFSSDNANSEPCGSEPCGSLPEVSPATSKHLKSGDWMSDEASSFEENSSSAQELSHSGISYEETNGISHIKGPPVKGRKQRGTNESDDEGTNRIKRMCGLDDLDRAGFSQQINPGRLTDAASQRNARLNTKHCMMVGSMVNGSHSVRPSFKRKRSQVVHAHEFFKKKHCHRTLTKVLDTLVMVPIMFYELNYSKVVGIESNETKRTIPLALNINGTVVPSKNENAHAQNKLKNGESSSVAFCNDDGDLGDLFDVPIDIEELHAGCSHSSLKLHGGASVHNSHIYKVENVSHENQSANEFDPTSTKINHVASNLYQLQSTSKWQIKGKRNLRHHSKTECLDVHLNDSNALENGIDLIDPFSPSSSFYPYRSSRKYISDIHGFHRSFSNRLSCFTRHPRLESPEARNHCTDVILYDVNIQVKASYRPQHVPYISLMSKLNGKAITGHPIIVEAMDDGYCDSIFDASDYNPTSSGCEIGDDEVADKDYEVKPKGTKCPKPRPQPSPSTTKSSRSKKHGSSFKKTRRLCALTLPRRSNHDKGKPLVQNLKGPTLACIPLKIVFSRINEALNGLARSSYRHHRSTIR